MEGGTTINWTTGSGADPTHAASNNKPWGRAVGAARGATSAAFNADMDKKAPALAQKSMAVSMASAVKMAAKLKSKASHAKVRIQKFRDDLGVKDAFATRCWRRAHMNGHHHRLRKIATEKGYWAKTFEQHIARHDAHKKYLDKRSKEEQRNRQRKINAGNAKLMDLMMSGSFGSKVASRADKHERAFKKRVAKAQKRALRASKTQKINNINRENKLLLQRIRGAKGSVDFKKWEKEFDHHKPVMSLQSTFLD